MPGLVATGTLLRIAGAPELKAEWGGGRWFAIDVALQRADLPLKPGMSVRVEVQASAPIESAATIEQASTYPLPLDGEVYARDTSAIAPPTIEDLWQLNLTQLAPDGVAVKQGDVVATFDGGEVQKKLGEKRSALAEKVTQRDKLRLELAERERTETLATAEQRARLDKAQRKASQPAELLARADYGKLVAERDLAERQMLLAQRREALATAQRSAERALVQAEYDQLAREVNALDKALQQLVVKAPRDGMMLHLSTWQGEKFDVGSQVWRGQSVAQVPDLATLAVRAQVPERDLMRVAAGARARVRLDGGAGALIEGRVLEVGRRGALEVARATGARGRCGGGAGRFRLEAQARPDRAGGDPRCGRALAGGRGGRHGWSATMKRCALLLLAMLPAVFLAGCGDEEVASVPVERLRAGPVLLEVEAEGELRSTKATPLLVPGAQWAQRQLAWMKAEGSAVKAGEVVARFAAPVGQLELAKSELDLQRNALAHGGKHAEMRALRDRVDVDLAQVGTDLGIAQRYADADLDMFARNEILDAVQDEAFLGEKQGVLQWRRGQGEERGAAEVAVLDSQRATYELNASTRRNDLAALELSAPHDGVLVLTQDWAGEKPKIGGGLWAGMEFGSLPDTAAMEVRLSLPQLMAQGIRAGAAVRLHPLGRPELAFDGTVSWVAGSAQAKSRENRSSTCR